MLGDELQDAIEMLVELVHLAQRLEDPMVPTHMSSETYVLIRIVNVFTVDGKGGTIGPHGMSLESSTSSHNDHLSVAKLFFIQFRLQDVIVP